MARLGSFQRRELVDLNGPCCGPVVKCKTPRLMIYRIATILHSPVATIMKPTPSHFQKRLIVALQDLGGTELMGVRTLGVASRT